MAYVDPGQVYWYLRLQHGVSDAAARGILANIRAESSFKVDAVGDGGTSGGLFQHHLGRWDNLKNYANQTGRVWNDWTAQVDFAIKEAKSMRADLQSDNAVEFSKWWTIYWERPADRYNKAEQRAQYVDSYIYEPNSYRDYGWAASSQGVQWSGDGTSGMSYQAPSGGGGGGSGGGGSVITFDSSGAGTSADTTSEPVAPPSGYEVWEIGGVKYAVYDIDGLGGASAQVGYRAPDLAGAATKKVSETQARQQGLVLAGSTEVFRGMPEGATFQDMVDRVLYEAGIYGSDAMTDQGVMDIIALYVARGMSEAELINRIQDTGWYQSHTDRQRTWNDKSKAQQDQEVLDYAGQLISRMFTYAGSAIDLMDYDSNGDGTVTPAELQKGNKDLYQQALSWASGSKTEQQIINEWLKPLALENSESPWSRMLREEEIAQGQWGADNENKAQEIIDLARRWGVPLTDKQAAGWANDILMNDRSDADLVQMFEEQAAALYPTKPEGVETYTWASPYLTTYQQLMESGEPDLFDNHVQSALTQGMNLGDFRKQLKQTDQWMETKNARDEMFGTLGALGRTMGFQ